MHIDDSNNKITWRHFQQNLQKQSLLKSSKRRVLRKASLLLVMFLLVTSIAFAMHSFIPILSSSISSLSKAAAIIGSTIKHTADFCEDLFFSDATDNLQKSSGSSQDEAGSKASGYLASLTGKIITKGNEPKSLTRQEIREIIDPQHLINIKSNHFSIQKDGRQLTFDTTLDMKLQHFLTEKVEGFQPNDRGKPEIIAMVVMEPHTGKILAMTGFDNETPCLNPCTLGNYPAASIFKMVTASAAVETCGYNPATTLYFNGGKYTLYKRQLKDTHNKYSSKVTFANAFAESINPVFGKLGSIKLGGEILEEYARSFGFNQQIDSDMPFNPGTILITEDNTFQWAEVASGFNKTTTISPLFGAMIASTLLNFGKTPVPSIVESVTDQSGSILYKRKSEVINSAVKPETARAVMTMMNKTITRGTARKSFRGFQKDATLSKLNIGGKTGSLYNREHTVKFDWFTGFCKENQGKEQIVVSVVVGHGKYIGTRASRYGRMIFTEYFNNFYALSSKQSNNG
ncbi:PbpA (modular protein) [Desulfamplus magnetovallimortis]|uniref:PbpA (Modular protein) n=1 Tax=Desulfamplus magnetovallimortis TaxID=1246637 RepID=A0A1W1HLC7_9BACT|nr:penicillin-binding transpeptidase domain-containing protein [Desulfamplus magnetovallimortis]SLM33269.1 PbpA (modular protein) [Desulfamplus magnetovallimortis]